MTHKDEALKLAYEALEFDGFYGTQKQRAITAIKQALAAQPAPVQEPVAQEPLTDGYVQLVPDKCDRIVWRTRYFHLPIANTPPAQPAPVQDSTCNETLRAQDKAYPRTCKKCGKGPCIGAPKQPLAQPALVPLTDELEALFTNIDHAISSGAWNVQKGSQTWEVIEEAKTAHGITEKGQP
jgi:hypothetical protein